MKLYWPLDKVYVTQGFGVNQEFYSKYGMKGHNGVDLRTRFIDSPLGRRYVHAAASGIVSEINVKDKESGYGIYVRVRHGDGSETIYAHLTKTYVFLDQHVNSLERIGLSGNTGDSTGPHLHFGWRPSGWNTNYGNGFKGYENPAEYLSKQT